MFSEWFGECVGLGFELFLREKNIDWSISISLTNGSSRAQSRKRSQSNMAARFATFPVVFIGVFTTLTIAFFNRRKFLPDLDEIRDKQNQESFNKAREIRQQLKEGIEERRREGVKGEK